MKSGQIIFNVFSGVLILVMGGVVWSQSLEVEGLKAEVEELQVESIGKTARGMAADGDEPRGKRNRKRRGLKNEGSDETESPESRARAAVMETIRRKADTQGDSELLDGLAAGEPEAREAVRSLVREEQKAMRAERRERRMERWAERQTEQLQDLKSSANLTDTEVESLDMYLTEERETMSAIWSDAREKGEWREAREKSTSLRSETDLKVSDVLSEDQFDEYSKMREDAPGMGRRGPRGGGSTRPAPTKTN